MSGVPAVPDLEALERRLEGAFATGQPDGLEVIGHGEITSVVAWPTPAGRVAAKRLPTFWRKRAFDDYRALFEEYLERLEALGVPLVPTTLATVDRPDGGIAAFALQPALDSARMVVQAMTVAGQSARTSMFESILRAVGAVTGAGVGFDGQLSNWGLIGDSPHYFDVTTPLLRDGAGAHRLDTDLFLASLPWAMRGAVRRFLVDGIMAKYFDQRAVMVDIAANLVKEGQADLMLLMLDMANQRVDPPIERREVARYYRADARLWAVLQRLRKLDRAWQLRVRRRPYPFLLPGKIER